MPGDGFLKRWSRLKATCGDAADAATPAPARPSEPARAQAAPVQAAPAPSAPVLARAPRAAPAPSAPAPPTLEDAARLTSDSDFSSFVARDVDKSVQRLALKKLFADPHFHVMDGLDMYMDDYNKPSPVSAAMLAALDHARSALRYPDAEKPEASVPVQAPAEKMAAGAVADPEASAIAAANCAGAASGHPDNVPVGIAATTLQTSTDLPQQSLQGQA